MKRTLHLLVALLLSASAVAQTYLATDFGARPDGRTLNTRSLQAAIDSAAAHYARTGATATVVLPEGQYVSGTLYLKSGVTLHLSRGAVLLGSLNPLDYVKDTLCRLTAFVFAVRQHHVAITGEGTIDGRGFEVATRTVDLVHLGLVQDPLKYDRPNETNRPQNLHFRECADVAIRGITLRNPANWCQEYDRCTHLLIEGVTVDAKCYWNNDGLDLVDCSHVVVRRCYIDASDDAYCFKSHNTGGLSEDVLVEDCVGRSSANGIKFGTLTRGTFRHFTLRNITIRDTYRSALTIASVDGAHIEDILVDGLRSLHTGNPLFLRFDSRGRGTVQPCLRNVVIRNLYAEVPLGKPDAGYSYEGPVEDQPRNVSPSSIVGTPSTRISNVRLENIELAYPGGADPSYAFRGTSDPELSAMPEWERRYPEFSMWKELPAWGFYLRHADSITFHNVTLRVQGRDYRPALVADDVAGLDLSGLTVSQPLAPKGKRQVVLSHASAPKASGRPDSAAAPLTSEQILALDNASPCMAAPRTFRASLFGCRSDGATLNTSSIQFAIDHIARAGGGTLVFEVGRYLTGSLQLRPGVDLQLNEGAILVGSPNPYDYTPAPDGAPALLLAPAQGTSRLCGLGMLQPPPGVRPLSDPQRVDSRLAPIHP